ncbi:MAG: hypothetical protein KY393_04600, partial [Actinobacteria bacterium]|nr:hypothetical protein [Actinomycetota bacterium]
MMLLFTLLGTNMAWASHDDSEPEVDPQLVEGNPACQADTVEAKIESPSAGEVPPAWHDRIMHARLDVGDQVLMASDSPPEYYEKPQGLYVSLQVDEPADAE